MGQHPEAGRDIAGEEMHSELLSRNIFTITMIGAVAFCSACLFVILH